MKITILGSPLLSLTRFPVLLNVVGTTTVLLAITSRTALIIYDPEGVFGSTREGIEVQLDPAATKTYTTRKPLEYRPDNAAPVVIDSSGWYIIKIDNQILIGRDLRKMYFLGRDVGTFATLCCNESDIKMISGITLSNDQYDQIASDINSAKTGVDG
jgi:hypothetical protein